MQVGRGGSRYNSPGPASGGGPDYVTFFFTFRGPCIVIYGYNKINEMRSLLKFIFGIELYMFRAGFLSIIRSLVTQQ